jgi:hypothetical protein
VGCPKEQRWPRRTQQRRQLRISLFRVEVFLVTLDVIRLKCKLYLNYSEIAKLLLYWMAQATNLLQLRNIGNETK